MFMLFGGSNTAFNKELVGILQTLHECHFNTVQCVLQNRLFPNLQINLVQIEKWQQVEGKTSSSAGMADNKDSGTLITAVCSPSAFILKIGPKNVHSSFIYASQFWHLKKTKNLCIMAGTSLVCEPNVWTLK